MDKHYGPLTEEQKRDEEIRRLRSENALLKHNLSKLKRGADETQEYHFDLAMEWKRKKSAFKARIAELEKALEPFADAYHAAGSIADAHPHAFEEFRRAAALLEKN